MPDILMLTDLTVRRIPVGQLCSTRSSPRQFLQTSSMRTKLRWHFGTSTPNPQFIFLSFQRSVSPSFPGIIGCVILVLYFAGAHICWCCFSVVGARMTFSPAPNIPPLDFLISMKYLGVNCNGLFHYTRLRLLRVLSL